MQNVLMCALALIVSTAGLSAQEATVISFPHQGGAAAPNGTYQGIAATSVTLGEPGPNSVKPCFDCVPGIIGSVTFGDPRYLLDFSKIGASLDVTLLIEDTNYTGPCTGIYVLVGNFKSFFGQQQIPGGCVAGTDYIVYWPVSFDRESTAPQGTLKGGVQIAPSAPVVSAVERPLQISNFPPPSGMIGPTTITIGVPEAGLPCYACAPPWGNVPTLSIPTPMFVVPRNQAFMVTMEIQDYTYDGPCSFVYQIKQGTTVVAVGSHSASCSAHSVRIPTWNVTIPEATPTGPANLSGGVIAGNQTYAMSQPILIQ
jgi:hypothetical protein